MIIWQHGNVYNSKQKAMLVNKNIKIWLTELLTRKTNSHTQWDVTTHPPDWLKLNRLKIPYVDKNMAQ